MIWDSLLFVDQNRNGAKYLKHYFKSLESNYKRTPISINMPDTTKYLSTKFNIASTILQSTTKIKKFQIPHYFGEPSTLLIKIKTQQSLKLQCLCSMFPCGLMLIYAKIQQLT